MGLPPASFLFFVCDDSASLLGVHEPRAQEGDDQRGGALSPEFDDIDISRNSTAKQPARQLAPPVSAARSHLAQALNSSLPSALSRRGCPCNAARTQALLPAAARCHLWNPGP
jgi:hypothetical protein